MKNNKQINQLTYEERMFYHTHKHKGITSKKVWENYKVSKNKKNKKPTTFEEHFSVYWWYLNRMSKAGVKWGVNKNGKPIFYNYRSLSIYNKAVDPESEMITASVLAKKIIENKDIPSELKFIDFLERFWYEISMFGNSTIHRQEKDIKNICRKLEIKLRDLWNLSDEQINKCKNMKFKSSFFQKNKLTRSSISKIKNMRFNTIDVDNQYLDTKHMGKSKNYTKIIDILDAYIIENGIKIKPDKTSKFLLSVFRHLWIWNDNFYSLDETPKNIKDKGFEAVGKHYRIYGKHKIFTSRWPLLHRFVKHYRKLEPKTPIEKKETFLQYLKRKLFGGGKCSIIK